MAFPLLTSPLRFSRLGAAVAVTVTLLASCEKLQNGVVNEIEFPEHEPRLAVNMFVSPGDSVVHASVYQSAGITDSLGSQPLRHAVLSLMQGNTMLFQGDSSNWVESPSGPWQSNFLMTMELDAPLQMEPGTVSLVVDASPTFEPLVVTETVPEEPIVEHLFEPAADTITDQSGYEYYNHQITVDLDNRPGVRDDYMIYLEAKKDDFEGSTWFSTGSQAFPDPRFEFNRGCACFLASDNGEDNVSMENIVFEAWGGDNSGYEHDQSLRLRVLRPTASLVNHFRSVHAYYNALNNPFAEPTSIEGNIPDGFGIFGVTTEVVIPVAD